MLRHYALPVTLLYARPGQFGNPNFSNCRICTVFRTTVKTFGLKFRLLLEISYKTDDFLPRTLLPVRFIVQKVHSTRFITQFKPAFPDAYVLMSLLSSNADVPSSSTSLRYPDIFYLELEPSPGSCAASFSDTSPLL